MNDPTGELARNELRAAVAAATARPRAADNRVRFAIVPSPIGELLLTSDGEALTGLHMESHAHWPGKQPDWRWDQGHFRETLAQLQAYFAGELRTFSLTLRAAGTAFQQKVWTALNDIPYGVTISYAELARRIGQPTAMRAVGLANGRNPLSIIVPCHRVIGASGALTGYGGGVDRKRWLLRHEGVALREDAVPPQTTLL